MPRVEPLLLAHIRRVASPEGAALPDAELVGRYAERRDAAAFEVLVWRHGPMVWSTCRRVLRHQHDVEDAFQATFLALARAAGTLGTPQAVGGWLHRVATNASLKLKAKRTTGLEGDVPDRPDGDDGELAGAVDEELNRLPERMRAAFVLCCLEGLTSAEAARELGCPVGTIDSRLHAARARLRHRLTRRGFGPSALSGLILVAPPAASVATAVGAGRGVAPSLAVDALATQVARIMSKGVLTMKAVTVGVIAVAFTGAVWALGGAEQAPVPKGPPDKPGTQKEAPMNAVKDEWSEAVNGLRARVALVEKPRSNGTRMLHPYLELRNVDDMAYPLKVRLGGAHVKFELIDAGGEAVDSSYAQSRSGPHPDPGTISLPIDSSLRVSMYCTNWGIPRDAAAMVATDSGAWVLKPEQEGKVFLRATVSGKKQDGDDRVWFGELETKTRVTWSGEGPQRADRPRQPGGILGHQLGTYLTIEGVKAEGGKVETNTLLVDTVNGKKLDRPVMIAVRLCDFNATRFDMETNHHMPVKVRCVYKGFESGGMIGVPPAVYAAAKELGRADVPMSPAAWQWRPHFVALIAVKAEAVAPKG
jgi:RNA polymerase sigma factor (sigma-70 family)